MVICIYAYIRKMNALPKATKELQDGAISQDMH